MASSVERRWQSFSWVDVMAKWFVFVKCRVQGSARARGVTCQVGQRGFTEIRLLSTFRHIFGNLSLYGEGLLGKVKSWREVGGVWGGPRTPLCCPRPRNHTAATLQGAGVSA